MSKKDEITKKNNIIIKIAGFAIIAIAIISAISFFMPKSHAQVKNNDFDKVMVSGLNKLYSKSLKSVVKHQWSKNYRNFEKETLKAPKFAKFFDVFGSQEKTDHWTATVKNDHNTAFSFASAKAKDVEKFSPAKANFLVKFQFEKENQPQYRFMS